MAGSRSRRRPPVDPARCRRHLDRRGAALTDDAFTGRSIYERAQRLAFPRYPGTEGDLRAIRLVRSWFEEAGLETAEEEFSYDVKPAFRALRALLLLSAAGVASAAILGLERPWVGLGVLTLVWGAAAALLGWAPWLERIYRREGPVRTANVFGTRRCAADPCTTVILLAHHDSKSQNLTLPFRALATAGALGGGIALFVCLLVGATGGTTPTTGALVACAVSVLSLFVLATLRNGNASPGGVDNAGSVAIVAELARLLPGETPENVELIFLSPGAEEDHMVGAMRWLDRHLAEFSNRDVVAINLDGAGIPGRVALLERFGFGRSFSRRLSRVARSAAAATGLAVRGTFLPPAMGVDAIPFAHRKVDCLTLSSGSLGRAVAAVHSPRDRGENLDPAALEKVARLAREMVRILAAGPGPAPLQRGELPYSDSNSAQAAPAGSRMNA